MTALLEGAVELTEPWREVLHIETTLLPAWRTSTRHSHSRAVKITHGPTVPQDLESEKQVWRDALTAKPDLCHEVQEVVAEGDVEMERVIVTGTLRHDFAGVTANGRSFRMDQAVICHLDNGKVIEAWEIADVGSLDDQ